MLSIGIDSTEIERFIPWTTFSHKKLSRVFSKQEIEYSLTHETKQAERLAVRFAAKEAFYKAVTPLLTSPLPFFLVCKSCTTNTQQNGMPLLEIAWANLNLPATLSVTASFTHTQSTATAVVLIIGPKNNRKGQ